MDTNTNKKQVKMLYRPNKQPYTNKNSLPIFRFNFSDKFVEQLGEFASKHRNDDRHQFKDAWGEWIIDNNQSVRDEVDYITNLGYNGDCLDKMFKSARYYFKDKRACPAKTTSVRHAYTRIGADVLNKIDTHILSVIGQESFRPKKGYELFINVDHPEVINDVYTLLSEGSPNYTMDECIDKIKKTYKNRYVVLTKKKLD